MTYMEIIQHFSEIAKTSKPKDKEWFLLHRTSTLREVDQAPRYFSFSIIPEGLNHVSFTVLYHEA